MEHIPIKYKRYFNSPTNHQGWVIFHWVNHISIPSLDLRFALWTLWVAWLRNESFSCTFGDSNTSGLSEDSLNIN